MERKDWVMISGFVGTILTILVVFFAGLQTVNSRFDSIDSRFDGIDNRLQAIDQRTFEMNTRLSRIEGKLDITVSIPNDGTFPPAKIKE